MATIEKQTTYKLSLDDNEAEALWFHLKYACADNEDEKTAPHNYIALQERIYQTVRKILNKD